MSGMIVLYVVVGVIVIAAIAYRLLMFRVALDGGFRTTLHERVDRVLAPYEGQQVSAALLGELRQEVEVALRDGLVDYGRPDVDFAVTIRNDDVLGPVCFIRTADGTELPLSEFERHLRNPQPDAA